MNTFDQIRNAQTEQEAPQKFERLTGCPSCRKISGRTMVGRQRVEFCTDHKVFWLDGLNPWSPPFSETGEEQKHSGKNSAFKISPKSCLGDWACGPQLNHSRGGAPWTATIFANRVNTIGSTKS